MQEEVENRTINIVIATTRLSARKLEDGLRKYLNGRAQKKYAKRNGKVQARQRQKEQRKTEGPHGKQTMKQLVRHSNGLKEIPVRGEHMKDFEKILKKYGFQEWNAILAAIGHGGLKEGQVANRLIEEKKKDDKQHLTDEEVMHTVTDNPDHKPELVKSKNGIVVEGLDDLAVHFSHCCNPIPGDEIVGFVTRGRGISIHRTDCINVLNLPENERSRLIEAEWQDDGAKSDRYKTAITVFANNRIGLIVDVSRVLAEAEVDIKSLNTRVSKQDIASVTVEFMTSGVNEINSIIGKLRQIEGVIDIQRNTG